MATISLPMVPAVSVLLLSRVLCQTTPHLVTRFEGRLFAEDICVCGGWAPLFVTLEKSRGHHLTGTRVAKATASHRVELNLRGFLWRRGFSLYFCRVSEKATVSGSGFGF